MLNIEPKQLKNILYKFQIPKDKYMIVSSDEPDIDEFVYVIKNEADTIRLLLTNSIFRVDFLKERIYYEHLGYCLGKMVPRRINTLEIKSDKDDPVFGFLYNNFSLYELKKEQTIQNKQAI